MIIIKEYIMAFLPGARMMAGIPMLRILNTSFHGQTKCWAMKENLNKKIKTLLKI